MNHRTAAIAYLLLSLNFGLNAQKLDSLLVVADTATNERMVKTLNELFREHLQSNPVLALEYSKKALALALDIDDKKGIAASYNNLGVAYRTQGALDNALEYYISSLRIYEDLDNKEGIATLKNNIANIYVMKKDYGQAMKYLQESYEIFSVLKDNTRIIGSMNNLGNLNQDLQLYEKAMEYYSKAYQLSEMTGERFPDALDNMGNIYFNQGNYQKAIDNYQKALLIQKENNNRLGVLNTITNIGIAYSRAGQPKPAQQYLSEAEALAQELQAYTYMPPILKYNAEIFYKAGKMKDAYLTLTKYDSLREKIYGEESTKKIAQMELVLDFQEKEKELEILQKEDVIKTLQLRNSRLFIVLAILGVLIILGVVNLYFMGNRKKIFGIRK